MASLTSLCLSSLLCAQEPGKPALRSMPTYGHSMQGEAFNEGPRQKAYLMRGMSKVVFPVSSQNPRVQAFIEQGIAQIHAYWYFEAERSFRQAAKLDPKCAIAFWGMAKANINNETRAKGFAEEALKRLEGASEREKAYVEALAGYYNADPKMKDRDKTRRQTYVNALKRIADSYPEDLEAQAFLGHELLERFNRYESIEPYLPALFAKEIAKEKTREATAGNLDRFLNHILKANPAHPSHHYRIHLWDYTKAANALNSAAQCGPSDPGIAHMWHMPGHIYTRVKRYQDAAYYQEASARTDHAHMMRDRVLPDQIHNYAHNNQWLVETYEFVGRVRDALAVATNMIELPRHPQYNNPDNGYGSAALGRMRLFETLLTYDLWKEAIALDRAGYLEPTRKPENQNDRLKLLAVAGFLTGDAPAGEKFLGELEARLAQSREKNATVGDAKDIEQDLAETRAYRAAAMGDKEMARKQIEKLGNAVSGARLARLWALAGDRAQAEKIARDAYEKAQGQVAPLATLTDILAQAGKRDEAKKRFAELRTLAGAADKETPLLAKLAPLAHEMGCSAEWRIAPALPADAGKRPPLPSFGPLRWEPVKSPDFTLRSAHGEKTRLSDYRKQGKATLVLFSLGAGCERCVAQLNAFAPMNADFEKAGVSLVAVTTEDRATLLKPTAIAATNKLPFPLLSDSSYRSYKAFRAFDDFEEMPLHGAYLIDAQGRIRWQDISYQAFLDAKFLLEEAKRLLAQSPNTERLEEKRNRNTATH